MAFPVIARQNTPPGSPSAGERYLVGTAPTGAWAGHANKFAVWQTSLWTFRMPVEGETTYDQTDDVHLFFDGTAWTPFTLGGGGGGGASADSNNFLFIRSSVGIMNRTGLSWFGQTSGPNTTTETVSGNDWIRLRMPVVSGGGSHFSVRWWSAPGGDKVITARIMGTTALPGSPCRFAIAARNPGGAQYTFGYNGVSGEEQLLLQRWNSAWGGPSEIYGYRIIHRWIDRWRMVVTGTTIVAQYWVFGVWMDLGEMTHSEVSSITEVGLMIQRVGNVDTVLYCDEFQVTT